MVEEWELPAGFDNPAVMDNWEVLEAKYLLRDTPAFDTSPDEGECVPNEYYLDLVINGADAKVEDKDPGVEVRLGGEENTVSYGIYDKATDESASLSAGMYRLSGDLPEGVWLETAGGQAISSLPYEWDATVASDGPAKLFAEAGFEQKQWQIGVFDAEDSQSVAIDAEIDQAKLHAGCAN